MSRFILLNKIKLQNANAISGFTWGFPAITHFLGFIHHLGRKLNSPENAFNDIQLGACSVISHKSHVHTYQTSSGIQFVQSRNPPYLPSHDKSSTPPVIEEGKMNMIVSLLISYEGNIGNRSELFIRYLEKSCFLQRLAGGTILEITEINLLGDNRNSLQLLKRKLLPGFVLMDRSQYLKNHFESLEKEKPNIELLDAWLDFSKLQYRARPKSDLINKHFQKTNIDENFINDWENHIVRPYLQEEIPHTLKTYFEQFTEESSNKKLLKQWDDYCNPTEQTNADWKYVDKPNTGYLVPIMLGYKSISKLYNNNEVKNTRDNHTPVSFVESAYSIGEWLSVHKFKNMSDFENALWHYHYEKEEEEGENAQFAWYLCKQTDSIEETNEMKTYYEDPEEDFR